MLQDGDNKERMIKAQLLEGLQETVIADNLGSRPIEGVDMPFKSTAFSAKGKLMMVEELGVDPAADQPSHPEDETNQGEMIQYLVPTGLLKFNRKFDLVEDIKTISAPKIDPPKPG